MPQHHTPRVGLFATCLMNAMRPNIGFSAVALLEQAGCRVEVPVTQTCCGQPAWSAGTDDTARALARQLIAQFEAFDYVVASSGSCIGTLHKYPQMLADDTEWAARAQALADKSHELLSFLSDVLKVDIRSTYAGRASYHDSCSGLRELGVKQQPRSLLAQVKGLSLLEMDDAEVCCGFGGSFCMKYPAISEKMVDDKIRSLEATGADTLLGGDLGCLLNIAGRLKRKGSRIRVLHTAEVLAGRADGPAIGDEDPR
ncbi:(Fe-S)-binding protein [Niveibacterium umoris]|uniref:L-lactate dehydrogenase complex protein LldE n=1 Tax=Niveibacterium umoris TaxID=1193620 RepID=A0A840BRX5_9RHOO|nr:(Fe-S)-binding protein [Niveibacterium umoris]MBB4014278.1 L-lactate dehydrogenase complex protein LldE [Niveibacterium umoris]